MSEEKTLAEKLQLLKEKKVYFENEFKILVENIKELPLKKKITLLSKIRNEYVYVKEDLLLDVEKCIRREEKEILIEYIVPFIPMMEWQEKQTSYYSVPSVPCIVAPMPDFLEDKIGDMFNRLRYISAKIAEGVTISYSDNNGLFELGGEKLVQYAERELGVDCKMYRAEYCKYIADLKQKVKNAEEKLSKAILEGNARFGNDSWLIKR